MKYKSKLFLYTSIGLLAGILIGYISGTTQALNFCVDTGLKLVSLDGVVISFSDAMKGLLKYYSGEWQ